MTPKNLPPLESSSQEKLIAFIQESLKRCLKRMPGWHRAELILLGVALISGAASTAYAAKTGIAGNKEEKNEAAVQPAKPEGTVQSGAKEEFEAWQIKCLVISGISFISVVSTAVYKGYKLPESVADAEQCSARLRSLEARLACAVITTEDAAKEYQVICESYPKWI